MSRNGISTLAAIAPTVLTASREPDSLPAWRASSASRADAAGKLIPSTIVTGSTTRMVEASSAWRVASGLPGSRFSGRTSTPTSPTITSTATTIWATARNRTGSPMRERTRLNTSAPRARPIRNTPRMTVNTYVVLPVPEARSRVHSTW